MTHLELRDIVKTFATATVAGSLTVPSGERLVLLGSSGCGKTTMLRLIAGLIEPDRGDILFDGASVLAVRPERRGAVMAFQEHALFPFRSVGDNVGYGLRVRRIAKAERKLQVAEALRAVRLDGFESRWPDELSGGQRQRVALARAIVVKPKLLLLDEPLSSLDRELRLELRTTICELQEATGITTIIVTHDQDEARAMAEHVAIMIDGEVRQTGLAAAVFDQPADRDVAKFLGMALLASTSPEQA